MHKGCVLCTACCLMLVAVENLRWRVGFCDKKQSAIGDYYIARCVIWTVLMCVTVENVNRSIVVWPVIFISRTVPLSSCLINVQPLLAHSPAADDNSLIGCTSHNLTDDWLLASTHFVDSQCAFQCSFGCVPLLNQMFWK